MTVITIHHDAQALGLKLQGHTGHGEPGKSILCSAVSALAHTLDLSIGRLNSVGMIARYDHEVRQGYFYIRVLPRQDYRLYIAAVFDTVLTGLIALSLDYPEHIRIDHNIDKTDPPTSLQPGETGQSHPHKAEERTTMDKTKDNHPITNLQLFGESGADTPSAGEDNPAIAEQETGGDDGAGTIDKEEAKDQEQGLSAEFEDLIKGQYKEQFTRRVENIIKGRLKGERTAKERLTALQPLLSVLADKYDAAPGDYEGLYNKLTSESVDPVTPSQDNQVSDPQLDTEVNDIVSDWQRQEQELSLALPEFSLSEQLHNPRFADLLRRGVDVKTAYIAANYDELLQSARHSSAQDTKKKVAEAIKSAGARATENAASDSPSIVYRSDPKTFTDSDWQEIKRRVGRGEIITF